MLLVFFNASEGGGGAPNEFSPPIRYTTSRWNQDTLPDDRRFVGRLTGIPVATNVYKLVSGAYTENHPGDESLIATTYFGARRYIVSDSEKAALIGAGYEVS